MNGVEPFGCKKVCDGGSDAAGRADNNSPGRPLKTTQDPWV